MTPMPIGTASEAEDVSRYGLISWYLRLSAPLNFRRLPETHAMAPKALATINTCLTGMGLLLRQGTIVDATIIYAPPSTKNATKARGPEMHRTCKGQQWYFGMKAHIGVDVESGLVHTVTTTAANAADMVEVAELLHGKEKTVYADTPTSVLRADTAPQTTLFGQIINEIGEYFHGRLDVWTSIQQELIQIIPGYCTLCYK